ncbi:helix-turn-helix transcriptional regulator [Actinacidiphila paucisporea]|uniref:Regulatory protein, luxR family n=1 Tax=Actinacidiphila paucisporea TaxID=310782 RepID=A0A1M6Z2R6_9ACTN|nr:AAA family ATPase [Actinacidiphila paucisporea]SHL24589.1 regulatory protein, luxR family [Actinacidiphila paucisporea]
MVSSRIESGSADARLTGRSALLTTARAALDAGDSVLITGEPGIGRSTVLAALAAERAGNLVLRCAPAESERHLPFLGMIDLLSEVGPPAFEALSSRERTLLRAALHRTGEEAPRGRSYGSAYDDVLTLRVAVLKTLAALCERSPVLLVLDDAQWLDRPSAEALAFVARRARRLPLTAIAAVRTPYGPAWAWSGKAQALCPAPVLALPVPPMTACEVAALLAGQEGPTPSGAQLARLHEASGGNPHAALELARALAEEGRATGRDPAGPLPIPPSLRRLLLRRLTPLTSRARRTLLAASAAARPTVALLCRAGFGTASADVRDAVRLGVVEPSPTGTVRFTQPLMPRVLYEDADPAVRRRVHAALAGAADDPAERAHHLASLTPGGQAETVLPPTPLDALTGTEHRVALLVAQGASNREIATHLTISVKTVEAALTRAYRKLAVRSRVSLARAVMARGETG